MNLSACKISVLICTHNPSKSVLRRVLEALPVKIEAGSLEIILIDNASNPPLTADEFSNSCAGIIIVRETMLGSVYARRTALRSAKGELCIFVDDDNILAPDYLPRAVAFMDEHPEVGAAGGKIVAEFETDPPKWMHPYLGLLAIRDLGSEVSISAWVDCKSIEFPYNSPYGAGMVIRRECSINYLKSTERVKHMIIGRRGTRFLGGCEDAEVVLFGVLKGGWQTGYCPNLHLTHVIPSRRISPDYLNKLAYQTGISWGEFEVRHGFHSKLPRWTVPLRLARKFLQYRAWITSGRLAWQIYAGQCVGRARKQPHETNN